MTEALVDVSRLQFAVTALYHFLFVPLTLGLAWILVIMEAVYVITGKQIYQDMVKFWGKLFGINFALGVTTGITLEFQFGTNWAYYSHYMGDIFGAPLAIEGLMAFFLESTFVGLFFFGWQKLSKLKHFMVTILMAIGSNLSALWILVANGWMQDPVGSYFNYETMRMELLSFSDIFFNPTAQAKFVHTISAGYVTASCFVLGLSAFYLLRKRDVAFARCSFRVAAAFGFASALSVIVLGDESGYTVTESQQSKLAAIEAIWETEPAPASFTLIAWPDQEKRMNHYAIEIPYVGGLMTTRSATKEVPGIKEILEKNKQRVMNGQRAVLALEALRKDPKNPQLIAAFREYETDLGFGLLLKKYTDDFSQVTPQMIEQATNSTVPKVAPLFFSFRIMVGLGFSFLVLFTLALYYSLKNNFEQKRWFLRWALWWIPMPWIAAELGWFVAEYGRQPWTVYGVLPTHLSVSSLSASMVWMSLIGFIAFYTGLLIVEMYLMIKYARLGPSSLGTGRYHLEQNEQKAGEH
ncbi:cytochrome ubiquinol oxidase subunit I [Neisseria sp. Ec49-e6-T10]|uniref:cytochrome ubiquinol oxidase subunit I n=1 Tax=Neisseria sp. Ec49-e6-T10 TaxID=3140744 RepID=UPI003EBD2FBF